MAMTFTPATDAYDQGASKGGAWSPVLVGLCKRGYRGG